MPCTCDGLHEEPAAARERCQAARARPCGSAAAGLARVVPRSKVRTQEFFDCTLSNFGISLSGISGVPM